MSESATFLCNWRVGFNTNCAPFKCYSETKSPELSGTKKDYQHRCSVTVKPSLKLLDLSKCYGDCLFTRENISLRTVNIVIGR